MANRKPAARRDWPTTKALANRAADWDAMSRRSPTFTGVRVIRRHKPRGTGATIDWTPFFITWELAGKYPRILDDEVVGEQARELFADAQAHAVADRPRNWLQPRAVLGFWPAHSNGEDIVLDEPGRVGARCTTCASREKRRTGAQLQPRDFVAPADDYLGGLLRVHGSRRR
jgi:5-methyltetrahydrofolate--homocysteine methyltransferase